MIRSKRHVVTIATNKRQQNLGDCLVVTAETLRTQGCSVWDFKPPHPTSPARKVKLMCPLSPLSRKPAALESQMRLVHSTMCYVWSVNITIGILALENLRCSLIKNSRVGICQTFRVRIPKHVNPVAERSQFCCCCWVTKSHSLHDYHNMSLSSLNRLIWDLVECVGTSTCETSTCNIQEDWKGLFLWALSLRGRCPNGKVEAIS